MPKTSIEWTDYSWPVINGCRRKSTGCEHCYAERLAATRLRHTKRYGGLAIWTESGRPQWTGEARLDVAELAKPLSWRKPRRIFVADMGDIFYEGVSFEEIAAVFGVMAAAPQHRFQVLTKRPERAREFFAWADKHGAGYDLCRAGLPNGLLTCAWEATSGEAWGDEEPPERLDVTPSAEVFGSAWPLPHVDVGVSVEDQRTADERIPVLLSLREHVGGALWVSYEPALGPIRFDLLEVNHGDGVRETIDAMRGRRMFVADGIPHPWAAEERIDWLIVGGESGPGARPFDLAWARSARDQCKRAGVPCFVKQLGSMPYESRIGLDLRDRKGSDMSEWPEDLRVREYPEVSRG